MKIMDEWTVGIESVSDKEGGDAKSWKTFGATYMVQVVIYLAAAVKIDATMIESKNHDSPPPRCPTQDDKLW